MDEVEGETSTACRPNWIGRISSMSMTSASDNSSQSPANCRSLDATSRVTQWPCAAAAISTSTILCFARPVACLIWSNTYLVTHLAQLMDSMIHSVIGWFAEDDRSQYGAVSEGSQRTAIRPPLWNGRTVQSRCRGLTLARRFPCPGSGGIQHSRVKTRDLFQCSSCRLQTSPIAGTIFASTKLPLSVWSPGHLSHDPDQTGHLEHRTRPPPRRDADHGVEGRHCSLVAAR